jgi:4-aminobutyrate aminotransferase
MAMTTSKYIYRHNYQPLPAGVFVAPYPYSYYFGWDDEATTEFCLEQLDTLMHGQTTPEETAAVIIEPVLGEGGYVPAPAGFLQELRQFCTRNEILLIVDEVQSGFGRTGKYFAYEHAGIQPDIIVMAKGLGSGLPISGIASRSELMDKWIPGTHGGTYGGGSAISAAAALATIQVIQDENLVENAARRGDQIIHSLRELQGKYSSIGDVRGLGLMAAMEFTVNVQPDKVTAKALQNACLARNLLLLTCGTYENVIRLIPPLVINSDQVDEAMEILSQSFAEVFGS